MFKKVLLPTVAISFTLLGLFLVFLGLQGSKPIQIEVEKEEFFNGKVADLLPLPLVTLISLGVGVSSGVVIGWKDAVSKSSDLEKKISNLNVLIAEKDSQISEFKLSPWNINQLNSFLDGEDSNFPVLQNQEVIAGYRQNDTVQTLIQPAIETDRESQSSSITLPQSDSLSQGKPSVLANSNTTANTQSPSQSPWVEMSTTVTEPLTIPNSNLETEEESTKQSPVRNAVSGFPAAQFAMGMRKKG